MRISLENVYRKSIVHETRRQIYKYMELPTQRLFILTSKCFNDVVKTHRT